MLKQKGLIIIGVMIFIGMAVSAHEPILNPDEIGFDGQTRSENYNSLLNALYSPGIVTTNIGNKLWVPWFSTSSSCTINDLHNGASCNSGEPINFQNNCMVSDELSQVGVIISMGDNQQRMNSFFNTLGEIQSNFGKIPSWKIYRDGNIIEPCREGINGNCDTASDATGRFIISLFTASNNPDFADEGMKSQYFQLAKDLTEDFVNYEILYSCKQSDLGQGDICYWLAAGSHAKNGGLDSNNFAYTGYYSDAIIAMLHACSNLDGRYCEIADDLVLNFLQASNFDGEHFTTPPGTSFKWVNLNSVPEAECTSNCYPPHWDYADASRATGICQANYYSSLIGHELPLLKRYCRLWGDEYMQNPASAPIQYYPNGDEVNYQSSYFAQGLQSLLGFGYKRQLVGHALDNSLSHYIPQTQTWDWASCFGVYMQAFPIRALGSGIGRDMGSFGIDNGNNSENNGGGSGGGEGNETQCNPDDISTFQYSCIYNGSSCELISDETLGVCRTVVSLTSQGIIQTLACKQAEDRVEVYRQEFPNSLQFEACFETGCVNQNQGFAFFNPLEVC